MAASISTLLEEDLKCAICQEQYKVPRTLPQCQHTYCRECLQKHIVTSLVYKKLLRKGIFKQVKGFCCPECRLFYAIKNPGEDSLTWVDQFPGNFKLASIQKKIRDLDPTAVPPDQVRYGYATESIEGRKPRRDKETTKSALILKGEFVTIISPCEDDHENAPEIYDLVVFQEGTSRVVVAPDFENKKLLSFTLSGDMVISERQTRTLGRKMWRICKTTAADVKMVAITASEPSGILVCDVTADDKDVWLPTRKRYDGIACLKDGRFVVTTKDNVDILGPDGTVLKELKVTSDQTKYPDISYVAVTQNQLIVTTDYESSIVSCITDDGKQLWQKKNKKSLGVASCDGDEDVIYFADFRTESVRQMTTRGRLMGKVLAKSDKLGKPSGVAVDNAGFLYVIGNSKEITVWKLSPDEAQELNSK